MKKILILLLFLATACSTVPEYIVKDETGAPIVIRDRSEVVADAVKLSLDSIYIVKYNRETHYVPLRYMGEPKIISETDTLKNGQVRNSVLVYKVVHISNMQQK